MFFWWSFGKNFGTFMNLLIRVDSQMIIKYKTKKTPLKRGVIIYEFKRPFIFNRTA